MWVYSESVSSYDGLIGKGYGGGETSYAFLLWFPDASYGQSGISQKLFFSANGIGSGGYDNRHIFPEAYDFPLNEWHHIAVTMDNSTKMANMYIDANLVTSRDFSGQSVNTNDYNLQIANYYSGNYAFEGKIDETVIWNSALTQSQIQAYFNKKLDGNEAGLVGYWNFNDGAGTTLTDQTSSGNDGTIINGAVWSTDAAPIDTETNRALSFDGGDDYVEIPHNSSLNISEINGDQGSVMAWVNLNYSDLTEDDWPRIISKKSFWNNPTGFELEVNPYANTIEFLAGDDNMAQGSLLSASGWNHIAATFNNSSAKIYFNGTDVTTDGDINPVLSNEDSLWIGTFYGNSVPDTGCCWFNGLIDDVALYNTELSQYQIQQVINDGVTVDETVSAYWNFNEGEGDTLTDQSANGNDGIINGASWSTDVPRTSLYPFFVVGPTGLPYHVIVSGLTVNGESPSSGTEIGIFDGTTCVGTGNYNPSSAIVTWEGNDSLSLAGFTAGDSIEVLVRTNTYNTWGLYRPAINIVTGDGNFGTGSYAVLELSVTDDALPDITTSTASLDFGALLLGASSQDSVVISNTGQALLNISTINTDR